jgi:YVTN family beta-propeller protein
VIDTASNTVSATIALGSPRGYSVYGIAIHSGTNKVYVARDTSGNSATNALSVIDAATNNVVTTIADSSRCLQIPFGIAVSPDGTKAYFTAGCHVSVIDTQTYAVTRLTSAGEDLPLGVAVTPVGDRVYVANAGSNTVSVIDTTTNGVIMTIPVDGAPWGVAVTPDGTKIYVSISGNSDNPGDSVSVIDTLTNTVATTIFVGSYPEGIAVTPDGARVYVANNGSGTVSVIGTASDTVIATIPVGNGPIAFGKFIGGRPSGSTSPPVAVAEPATTNAGTPVTIDLVAGATGNPTSAALIGTPVGGTDTGFPATSVTFTPTKGFTGEASFHFSLANAKGTSNTATATITVKPSPLVPVAKDQTVPATAGSSKTIDLSQNATGNPTSATIIAKPSHGGYALSGTQAPDVCYGGPDSFTFTLSNANGTSNVANATINVAPAQGPAVASTKVYLVDPFLLGGDLSNISATALSVRPGSS